MEFWIIILEIQKFYCALDQVYGIVFLGFTVHGPRNSVARVGSDLVGQLNSVGRLELQWGWLDSVFRRWGLHGRWERRG